MNGNEYRTHIILEIALIAAITDKWPDRYEQSSREKLIVAIYDDNTNLPINGTAEIVYTSDDGAVHNVPLLIGHDNFKYFESVAKKLIHEQIKKLR